MFKKHRCVSVVKENFLDQLTPVNSYDLFYQVLTAILRTCEINSMDTLTKS